MIYIKTWRSYFRGPFILLSIVFTSSLLFSDLLFGNWLQIDEKVQREIINHRSLRHPNIIQFREVTSAHFIWYFSFSNFPVISSAKVSDVISMLRLWLSMTLVSCQLLETFWFHMFSPNRWICSWTNEVKSSLFNSCSCY